MIATPQGWEWILIFAVIILLFGAAKLPQLARGTGQALRIFKAETKGLRDEETDESDKSSSTESENRELTPGERASQTQSTDDTVKRPSDS
ncbi:MAG: Sec-independent protein translocase subunit TatA [Nocardioidaceae bacterium]